MSSKDVIPAKIIKKRATKQKNTFFRIAGKKINVDAFEMIDSHNPLTINYFDDVNKITFGDTEYVFEKRNDDELVFLDKKEAGDSVNNTLSIKTVGEEIELTLTTDVDKLKRGLELGLSYFGELTLNDGKAVVLTKENNIVYSLLDFSIKSAFEVPLACTLHLDNSDTENSKLVIMTEGDLIANQQVSLRFMITSGSDNPITSISSVDIQGTSIPETDSKTYIIGRYVDTSRVTKSNANRLFVRISPEVIREQTNPENITDFTLTLRLYHFAPVVSLKAKRRTGLSVKIPYVGTRKIIPTAEGELLIDLTDTLRYCIANDYWQIVTVEIDSAEPYFYARLSGSQSGISDVYTTNDYVEICSSTFVDPDKTPSIIFSYTDSGKLEKSTPFTEIENGKSGTANVNLFSGEYNLKHYDTTINSGNLSVELFHYYSSLFSRTVRGSDNTLGFGMGWKTNLHQWLHKYKYSSEKQELKVVYTDGFGVEHVFYEKWYYEKNNEKHYVNRNDVYINVLGELTYTSPTGKSYPVTYDVKSDDGLTLTTSAGMFGYRDKTKFIEVTRGDYYDVFNRDIPMSGNDLRLTLYTPNDSDTVDFSSADLKWLNDGNMAEVSTEFISDFSDKRWRYSYSSSSTYPKPAYVNSPLLFDGQSYFTKYATKKHEISARNQYINVLNSVDVRTDFTKVSVSARKIIKFDTTLNDYYETEEILKIKEQVKQYDNAIKDAKENAKSISNGLESSVNGLEELKKSMMRILVSINQQKITYDPPDNKNTKAFKIACYSLEGNLTQIESQIDDTTAQINATKENLAKTIKTIDEYELTRDNLKAKLNGLIKKQKSLPNDFIIDENGNIHGFDFYGRLVLIADKYEKTIRIKFKEDKDLFEEIQTENGVIKFNYDNNDLLKEIVDISGKTICFAYTTTNLLTTIKYDEIDAHHSIFAYQNDLLTKVIDASGLNLNINYALGSTIVNQFTTTRIINDDGLVRFPEQQTKTILDLELSKTGLNTILTNNLNGAVTKYAFDELGRPLNTVSILGANTDYSYIKYNDHGDVVIGSSFAQKRILRKFIENGTSTGLSKTVLFSDLDGVSGKIWRGDLLNTDTLVYYFEFQNDNGQTTFSADVELNYKDGGVNIKSISVVNKTKYVLVPIMANKDQISQVKIEIPLDSQIRNFGIATGEGVFRTYDVDNNLIGERRGLSRTSYLDFDNKRPTKIEEVDRYNKTRFQVFSYNEKGQLTYSENQDGDIEERFYNEKGELLESVSYNKKSATDKTVSKYEYDEEGNVTELNGLLPNKEGKINPEKIQYYPGTKKVNYQTAPNGLVTGYGFDFYNGNLLSKSAEVDGIANTTNYHYQFGLMTSASHQEFDIHYELDGQGRKTSVDVACNNIVKFEYDDSFPVDGYMGTKVVTKYYNHQTLDNAITIISDIYGRTKSVTDTAGTSIAYNYDNFDRLTSTISSKESTHFEYDYRSNVSYSNVIYNNFGEVAFNYAYTFKDQVEESITTISDTAELYKYKTKFIYDPLDRVVQVHSYFNINAQKSDEKLTNEYDYSNRLIKERVHIKGDVETSKYQLIANEYLYLKSGNQATSLIKKNVTTVLDDTKDVTTYNYDEMGNITRIKNSDNDITYEYDKLSRITRENNRKLDFSKTFDYDESGNILRSEKYVYTKGELTTFVSGNSYSYNQGNYQDQLVDFNGEEIEYDGLGRPTVYRDHNLAWSPNSTLTSYDSYQYQYNEQGIRIKKVIGNTTHKYYVSGTKIFAEELITSGNKKLIKYKYFSEKLYGFNYENVDYYYLRNTQGDITSIITKDGTEVARYAYDAWGNHKVLNASGTEDTNPTSIGNINSFRYRGYYYDKETKLYYLNARYYDPEIGRFISQDNISYLAPKTINGLNLYGYCGNNPVMNVDPDGTSWWNQFWKVVGVVALAVVVVAAVALITVASGGSAIPVLIGAGIGAGVGFGTSVGMQLVTTGKVDWGQVFIDTAVGGIMGAFGGSAIGQWGMAIAGGAVGFGSSIAGDWVAGREINWGAAALAGAIGFGMGFIAGPGSQHGQLGARQAATGTLNKIADKAGRGYAGLRAIYDNKLNALTKIALDTVISGIGPGIAMEVISYLLTTGLSR